MESQQPARSVLAVVFGLVIFGLFAPAGTAAPLSAKILLENDRYVVGSKWTLDVVVNTGDPLSVKFSYGALPSTLALIEGPNLRETSYEESPGKMSRATRISLTLRTLAPGIQELGPWVVKVGNKDVPVPPVTVFLLAVDEAKRRFPVDARWVVPAGPYYLGQAIPLLLQARNLDTLLPTQDFTIAAPGGALLEKVSGLGEIEISSQGEDRIMNLPWGSWMLIPTREGTLTVPPVKLNIGGLTRSTTALNLTILPLPEGAQTTHAVGNLTYAIEAREGVQDQKGQLIVTQDVQGQGNFPSLVLPTVSVPGLALLSRQEVVHTKATSGGYEGDLLVTWRFQSEKAGDVSLRLPGFQAFQPSTGLVNVWEDHFVTLKIAPAAAPATVHRDTPRPLTWPEVLSVRPWGLWGSWLGFALMVPGLLFFASTFLPRRRRKNGLFVMLPLIGLFFSVGLPSDTPPEGFSEARTVSDWSHLLVSRPEEPGLWYNKALAVAESDSLAETPDRTETGQIAVAIHAVRMALRLGFQGPQAHSLLQALEEGQVMAEQFRPWTFLSADALFVILAVAFNLAFLLWGIQRLTARPFWLILASLAALSSLTAGTVLAAEETVRFQTGAVVGPGDGNLSKVPGPLAERWMSLRSGTVVKILGHSETDVLIHTGYGLEGWLQEKDLLFLEARP